MLLVVVSQTPSVRLSQDDGNRGAMHEDKDDAGDRHHCRT